MGEDELQTFTDEFSTVDGSKWGASPQGPMPVSLPIPQGPAELTMLCSGCGRPLFTVTPTVQATMLTFYHVEVVCGCGETTIYETTLAEADRPYPDAK
jgi:hypothetical protein